MNNTPQEAKVNLAIVREHCDLPPYVSLVKSVIKRAGGLVSVAYVKGETAGINAGGLDFILGNVEVPLKALTFAEKNFAKQ